MQKIEPKIELVVLVLSIAIAGITNYVSRNYFKVINIDGTILLAICELLKLLLIYLVIVGIVKIYLNRKNKKVVKYIKNFLIYFVSMMIIELLV